MEVRFLYPALPQPEVSPEEAWLEAGLPADTDLGSAQTHVLPHSLGRPHGLLGCSHVCLAEADPLLRGGGPAAGTQL